MKEGLKPTKNILKFTQEYKEDQDIFAKYLKERVENSSKNIHIIVLYKDFIKWFESNNTKKCTISKQAFTDGLKLHIKKLIKRVKVDGEPLLGVVGKKLRVNSLDE